MSSAKTRKIRSVQNACGLVCGLLTQQKLPLIPTDQEENTPRTRVWGNEALSKIVNVEIIYSGEVKMSFSCVWNSLQTVLAVDIGSKTAGDL